MNSPPVVDSGGCGSEAEAGDVGAMKVVSEGGEAGRDDDAAVPSVAGFSSGSSASSSSSVCRTAASSIRRKTVVPKRSS